MIETLIGKQITVPEAPVFKPSVPTDSMSIHFAVGTTERKKKEIIKHFGPIVDGLRQMDIIEELEELDALIEEGENANTHTSDL